MRPAHYRTRDILTPRQREVLALVARGYTNPRIARELGITLDGAKFQVSEILARLSVSSREEAAEWWRAERRPSAQVANSLRAIAAIPARWLAILGAGAAAMVVIVGLAMVTRDSSDAEPPVSTAASAAVASPTTCTPVDGPGFLRLSGVSYMPVLGPDASFQWRSGVSLGDVVGTVRMDMHSLPCDGADHTPVDGDALGLPVGTSIYAVDGYATNFRVAARQGGAIRVYQVSQNDSARTGADLLDIEGKLSSVDVFQLNPEGTDPRTELAGTIGQSPALTELVSMLLTAPVSRSDASVDAAPYRLDLHLADGSTIERNYYPESGAIPTGLSSAIITPQAFHDLLAKLVGGGLVKGAGIVRTPTPTPLRVSASCPVHQDICDFAEHLEALLQSDPGPAVLADLAPTKAICPEPDKRPLGLDYICKDSAPGDEVTGVLLAGKLWTLLPQPVFMDDVTQMFSSRPMQSAKVVAIGCPGEAAAALSTCDDTFALSLVPRDEPGGPTMVLYTRDPSGDFALFGMVNGPNYPHAVDGGTESLGIFRDGQFPIVMYWFQPWVPSSQ